MQIITSDMNLKTVWRSPIWPDSIYAPSLAILQSQTLSGRTASGADATRDIAFEKCLSETAEILALEDVLPEFDPITDGLAAHPDVTLAQHNAMLEALQRKAVLSWWRGNGLAKKIPANWLDDHQITSFVKKARTGATAFRDTQFWHLTSPLPCHCVVACSANRMGQDMILGFGTATQAQAAARLAATEVMLMELNLYTVMAARGGRDTSDQDRIEAKIREYAARRGALLPSIPADPADLNTSHGALSSTMPPHTLTDLTADPASRPVWLCKIDGMPSSKVAPPDHPFMAQ
ncbi:YcaO-like family protein [Pseudooctadecabacter jejudonensis]|uniref:YcaO-like family protein n=1 Tax=Pseudooctadecabacter jejudonensis TaxID=1391910 RepID=A0A1Y5TK44_9RHOB|nr:YcaO-like family protein [Pseudooctadecabacter jejudonensis]SLN62291.1 YcaO-like family protein [Pseudooctadecabacter jejudonensis]